MQHAPEPLERRTGAFQPAGGGEDTEARDQGRNTQEPSPDRRIHSAAPRTESEHVVAAEPRGEVAFAARLVPIAPDSARTPSEPVVQVREKALAPASPPPPAPQDPPRSLPVREIRLEVDRGERKVEVQLIERAGDVRVAVRTPDVRLATDIRDNLPALSSRLEQTGYRTETWHGFRTARVIPGRTSENIHTGSRSTNRRRKNHRNKNRKDNNSHGSCHLFVEIISIASRCGAAAAGIRGNIGR